MDKHSADVIDPLVRDFVEWIGNEPRPYRDVLDAWRTSCPRLTVWEEARDRGYVERGYSEELGAFIRVTDKGRRFVAFTRSPRRPARSASAERQDRAPSPSSR